MVLYATRSVKRITMEWDQCAGRIAPKVSVMTVHSVPNRSLMVVEQEALANVTTVKSGVSSGTPNASPASTTWRAASAHQTVHQTLAQTLVSLARRSHTAELQEHPSGVHLD